MGYFSNGTEGDVYQEAYCFRCAHWRDDDDGRGPGCPVWDAHLLYAYEEADSGSNAEAILDLLIPRSGISNERCRLFVAKEPT